MDALLSLLDASGPRLFRLLTRLTQREDVAEVLMQELFLTLSQSSRFRGARDPAGYAYRTAMNLAFAWRREEKRKPDRRALDEDPESDALCPLTMMIRSEQFDLVLAALDGLSEQSRDIVVMRYIHGDDYEEIARLFGKTAHQVRALCHKALCQVRESIGAHLRMGEGGAK